MPFIPSSPRPLPARRAYRPKGRLYDTGGHQDRGNETFYGFNKN